VGAGKAAFKNLVRGRIVDAFSQWKNPFFRMFKVWRVSRTSLDSWLAAGSAWGLERRRELTASGSK
jgi:hypothetical protein